MSFFHPGRQIPTKVLVLFEGMAENWEKGDSKMLKMAREVYWDFSTFRVFDFDKGEKRRKNQEPIYYTIQIFINIYIYRGSKILKKTEN